MNNLIKRINWSIILQLLLIIILAIASFPKIHADSSVGLDGSYFAMYNYWFAFDRNIFQDIAFPYGPLGFLIGPKNNGYNFEIALFFTFISRVIFIFNFITLFKHHKKNIILAIILILYALMIFNVFIIFGIITSGILLYEFKRKYIYLIIAGIFAAIGSLMKIDVCVFSAGFFIGYFIYLLFQKRIKEAIICFAFPFISLIILWLILFKNLNGIINIFYYWFKMSMGNSDYLSLYHTNNWFIIFTVFAILIALPIILKDKKLILIYIIMALSLLACFKYSFARMENNHIRAFFQILCLLSILSIATIKSNKFYIYLLILLMPSLFYLNMTLSDCYYSYNKELPYNGFKNFNEIVLHRKQYKKECEQKTKVAFDENKLSKEMLDIIGNKGIDFFPWDFSFPLMNDLNYVHCKTLQSIVHIEDKKLENISDEKLRFILWKTKDWNGPVGGINDLQLANSTGGFFFEFMNKFKPVYCEDKYTLFEKTAVNNFQKEKIVTNNIYKWNEWITVPNVNNGILRMKLKLKPTFLRTFVSAIYKPEPIFIEYLLSDSEIKRYRITSDIMPIGIWVSPYIYDVKSSLLTKQVIKVRFVSENSAKWFKNEINAQWLFSEFTTESKEFFIMSN